jgi:hypothetical protein
MKKLYILFISILIMSQSSFAQHSWSSYGDQLNSSVNAILPDSGAGFYIAGPFTTIGTDSVGGIAQWNGQKFAKLGQKGITGTTVTSLIRFGSGLVAAGNFSMIDTAHCNNIGYWDGLKWNRMDFGLDYTGATTVSTLVVFNGDLYAAGNFHELGIDTLNNIAKWNGARWVKLGTGTNGAVNTMCVYGGKLYAAGTFTTAGGVTVHNIARWDGTSWADVDGGLEYTGATTVSTLHAFNGNLYAGGTFNSAGGDEVKHNIAKWSGASWSDVGEELDYTGATTVSTLCIHDFDGKLIVETKYRSIEDPAVYTYGLESWNDTVWSHMDGQTDMQINSLQVINGSLFAGGSFTEIASDSVSFLAQWATSSQRSAYTAAIAAEDANSVTEIYPNPATDELSFRTTTGVSSSYTITLSDLLGRTVCTKENQEEKFSFKEEQVKAGAYIYRIRDTSGNTVKQGKVIFK